MSDPHGIALIGFGTAGRVFHAPLIEATPELDLRYVVTSSAQRAEQARQRYPHAEVLAKPEDLWQRAGDLVAAVVATPNASHVPLATSALQHGLGVVVDKPFAPTAAEADAVRQSADELGLVCTVYQNRRWDGDFRTAARLIADGALGRVARFESRFERWRPEVNAARWREDPGPGLAGGLLYDLGPHLIDQALQLFGPVRAVYAELGARREGALVDDDAFLALEHRSGTRSHLWMSFLAAARGPRLRVLGDRGGYVTWGMDPQEEQLAHGWDQRREGFGRYDPAWYGRLFAGDDGTAIPTVDGCWQTFYEQLAAALSGTGPPPVDPADAVAGLRIIEAAQASARSRSVVTMGEP